MTVLIVNKHEKWTQNVKASSSHHPALDTCAKQKILKFYVWEELMPLHDADPPAPCIRLCYESCTLKTIQVIVPGRTNVLTKFSCDLDRLPFDPKRSMRKFNSITAYLIPSLFRIKADRIFIGSNFAVTGNSCFAMLS